MGEDSLLQQVITAAQERHLSQNTLTAYRRTWLKLIAWSAAEGLALAALPLDRADVLWVSTGFFVRVIDMTVAR
jgi:site-specific recombinase XerC